MLHAKRPMVRIFGVVFGLLIIVGIIYFTVNRPEPITEREQEETSEQADTPVFPPPSSEVPAPGFEDVDEMVVDSDEDTEILPPPSPLPTPLPPPSPTPVPPPPPSPPETGSNTVHYTDSGYTPRTLTITAGTTVVFRNDSAGSVWTASEQHPTHTEYPDSSIAKCGTSAAIFDQCSSGGPGTMWTFTFTKRGSWDYHNHLRPSHGGTIVVQ